MGKADKPEEIEYIMGLDDNDPTVMDYLHMCHAHKFGLFQLDVSNSRNIIQALNRTTAKLSPTTQVIVGTADDQGCPEHWDTELFKVLEKVDNFITPRFVGVSDGLYEYGTRIQQAIMNRAFYNRNGWFICPEYDGPWADNDLFEVAKRIGIVDAPHLLFSHRHFTQGKSELDDTYRRINNTESMERNERVFRAREARNFDIHLSLIHI